MITAVSNVHTGDLVLPGLLVVGLVWLGYLAIRLTGLCIDRMARQSTLDQYADNARRLVKAGRAPYVGSGPPEVAPEDEPSWAAKAPHDSGVRRGVLPPPETPPETPAETSGWHAATESMAPVADAEPAVQAPVEEVAVHG